MADVEQVYCGGSATARIVMRHYGTRYVINAGGLLSCPTPTDFSASTGFMTVYDVDGVQIWRLDH